MPTAVPESKVLDSFQRVARSEFGKIQRGDLLKYTVDGELRYGGHVIQLKLDEQYVLLRNFKKKCSWRVYLNQPKLRIYKLKQFDP